MAASFECPFCGATERCEHVEVARTCGDCDAFMRYNGHCMDKGVEVDANMEIRLMTDTGEWSCIKYQRNENPCRTCTQGAFCQEWPNSLRCIKVRRPMLNLGKEDGR